MKNNRHYPFCQNVWKTNLPSLKGTSIKRVFVKFDGDVMDIHGSKFALRISFLGPKAHLRTLAIILISNAHYAPDWTNFEWLVVSEGTSGNVVGSKLHGDSVRFSTAYHSHSSEWNSFGIYTGEYAAITTMRWNDLCTIHDSKENFI